MKENKSTPGGLVLRGITLSYIALLIVLPVIAISCKAFDGGIALPVAGDHPAAGAFLTEDHAYPGPHHRHR